MTNSPYPYLIVRRGPNPDQSLDLIEETCIVGREPINDVVLADPEVSRRHARLVLRNGTYHIEDLSSTNGTYINGRRISSLTPLAHGDVIDFGETIRVVFQWPPDQAVTLVGTDRLKPMQKNYRDSAIFETSVPFPVQKRKDTVPISDPALFVAISPDSEYGDDGVGYGDAETISELSGPSLSPTYDDAPVAAAQPTAVSSADAVPDDPLDTGLGSRRNLWIGLGCGAMVLALCACGSLLVYLDANYPETLYGLLPF